MACSESGTVVAMEMLIEEQVVTPVGIVLEFLRTAEDGPASGAIALEQQNQSFRHLLCGIFQSQVATERFFVL